MDFFDERILAALKDGKPKGFTSLLSEVGFSHNTLQQHLRRLTTKGLIVREKPAATGFGRPRFAYHLPLKASKQVTAALEDLAISRHNLYSENRNDIKHKGAKTIPWIGRPWIKLNGL